jgi:hypothetical protein
MAMILKCNRTGNVLWSTKAAEKHADETGFQDFEQVAGHTQVRTARPAPSTQHPRACAAPRPCGRRARRAERVCREAL